MNMDATPTIALQDATEFWVTPDFSGARSLDVTVIIPSYNAGATLGRALRSVLDQGVRDLEVIVVDDASRDMSWNLVVEFILEDARVRGIRNKQNQGKPTGMNRAIALARGRWIAVLDADDWFEPDRLATLIALGERRQADMVADNQSFHDARAGRMVGTAWPSLPQDWIMTFDDFLAGSDAYETFSFGMLKPVVRRDFIDRTGLAYEPGARNGQDFFYLLQFFLLGGKAVICDRPLYCYTQPFGALSRQWSHGARRRYDFQTVCQINRRVLMASLDRLTPRQAGWLHRRNHQLECLEYYYSVKERLAVPDLAGAMLLAAKRPAIFIYLLRSLSRKYLCRSGSRVVQRMAQRARARIGV